MAKVILVTGGSRSGKSTYALQRVEQMEGSRVFVATCPRIDGEMDKRIQRHQLERAGHDWKLVEEECQLASAIDALHDVKTVLVDCLTLWINNLLFRMDESAARQFHEENMTAVCEQTLMAARRHPGTVIFVTNEVGWGIVPEEPLVRQYRDLVGWCNQRFAAQADEVVLVSCGLPLSLKK